MRREREGEEKGRRTKGKEVDTIQGREDIPIRSDYDCNVNGSSKYHFGISRLESKKKETDQKKESLKPQQNCHKKKKK